MKRAGQRLAGLICIAALAACSQEAPAPQASAPAEPAAQTQASTNVLSAEGWGPLRVGMSAGEVIAAVGDAPGATESAECREFHPPRAPEGVFVMLQDGALTRVSLRDPSAIETDRGFAVGADASAVEAAYGASAQTEPHKYESAPSRYITAWTAARPAGESYVTDEAARGVRYEIGSDGKVKWIRAGGPSIQLVESCS